MEKLIRFAVWLAIIGGIVIGAARLVLLRWWRVPSDDPQLAASVAPSLAPGDLVLLWRFTPPAFGDLVVCPDPMRADRLVVGRIVGSEGDSVAVDGTNVWVNDDKADTEYGCHENTFVIAHPTTGARVEQQCSVEALGQVAHLRGDMTNRRLPARRQVRKVGEGRVFLLSDNRGFPYDSRNFGQVLRASCKESVVFRLVSRQGWSDVAARMMVVR